MLVTTSQVQTWKGLAGHGELSAAGRTELLGAGLAGPLAAGRAEPSAMGTPEAPVQLSSWTCRPSRGGGRRRRACPSRVLEWLVGDDFGGLGVDLARDPRSVGDAGRFGAEEMDSAWERIDLARGRVKTHEIQRNNEASA